MPAELELGREALLERAQTKLVEACDRGLREGLVGEIGERRSAPQLECTTEQLRRRARISALESLRGVVGPPLELVEVEPARVDVDHVAG